MLNIYELTIRFKPSKDYLKLALTLHLFAIFLLFQVQLPLIFTIGITLGLLFSMLQIYRHNKVEYQSLCYQAGRWQFTTAKGRRLGCNHLTLSFDGGLFLILKLNAKKNWILFKDQIDRQQESTLRALIKTLSS